MKKHKIAAYLLLGFMSKNALAAQWDMPTPYGDANHPTQIAIEFAQEVSDRTDGKF